MSFVLAGAIVIDGTGVLAPGRAADVIAVGFDPLDEPEHRVYPDRVVPAVRDGVVVQDTRRDAP